MPPSIPPRRHLPLTYISGFWSLIILLVLSNGPAYAEWVEFTSNEEVGVTVYVDPGTIRRKGSLVKMWNMKDFKTNQSAAFGTYLSFKVLEQYDCEGERMRLLAYTSFSRNMGYGHTVFTNSDEGKWEPVQPGSKFACGTK